MSLPPLWAMLLDDSFLPHSLPHLYEPFSFGACKEFCVSHSSTAILAVFFIESGTTILALFPSRHHRFRGTAISARFFPGLESHAAKFLLRSALLMILYAANRPANPAGTTVFAVKPRALTTSEPIIPSLAPLLACCSAVFRGSPV
jgi:hypothetical protein